jgi:hypothetical protein
MWQIQAMQALDIARERRLEAAQHALVANARREREAEARAHGRVAPSRLRGATAHTLRSAATWLAAAASAASDAAARLDRRTA